MSYWLKLPFRMRSIISTLILIISLYYSSSFDGISHQLHRGGKIYDRSHLGRTSKVSFPADLHENNNVDNFFDEFGKFFGNIRRKHMNLRHKVETVTGDYVFEHYDQYLNGHKVYGGEIILHKQNVGSGHGHSNGHGNNNHSMNNDYNGNYYQTNGGIPIAAGSTRSYANWVPEAPYGMYDNMTISVQGQLHPGQLVSGQVQQVQVQLPYGQGHMSNGFQSPSHLSGQNQRHSNGSGGNNGNINGKKKSLG